jgi:hypothetical protein
VGINYGKGITSHNEVIADKVSNTRSGDVPEGSIFLESLVSLSLISSYLCSIADATARKIKYMDIK